MTELRQQNKRLGEAVTWILETLDREVDEEGGQAQRKQSLESLSYVRDILSGQINEIDERRLWGEAEFKRRWEARETSRLVPTAGSGSPRRPTPIPSSVNETLRGFISSSAGRAVTATADHGHSALSGTPVVSRAPVRVSANNPFQRVPSGGNAQYPTAGNRSQPSVQRQVSVQHDPLGVLG